MAKRNGSTAILTKRIFYEIVYNGHRHFACCPERDELMLTVVHRFPKTFEAVNHLLALVRIRLVNRLVRQASDRQPRRRAAIGVSELKCQSRCMLTKQLHNADVACPCCMMQQRHTSLVQDHQVRVIVVDFTSVNEAVHDVPQFTAESIQQFITLAGLEPHFLPFSLCIFDLVLQGLHLSFQIGNLRYYKPYNI